MNLDDPAGAALSRCGRYRYALWRTWDSSRPKVLFIGLNPSTADHHVDDPTLRRCVDFARRWGFGGSVTANLFAWRATKPADLLAAERPIGPRNNQWIRRLVADTDQVIAAWGNHGNHLNRADQVRDMVADLHVLRLTARGEPAHPLYLPAVLRPFPLPFGAAPVPSRPVAAAFSAWPAASRKRLLQVRSLIYEVASRTDGVGPLTETLKWGQPAYLTETTGSGTTIRLGCSAASPGECAVYVHCQTNLIATVREQFHGELRCQGNRAVVLDINRPLPSAPLSEFIALALRYHLDKSSRLSEARFAPAR